MNDIDAFDWSAPATLAPPRAAYVHVPFCRHRCGYCNFSVVAGRDDLADRFLDALEIELASMEQPKPVDTLFIGGGTPTHFDAPWLHGFLSLVCRWFDLKSEACEFTVEANPNDITLEKLDVLGSYGVNRISLGVQSFNESKLANLERSHSPKEAMLAIERGANVIGNVSIDLIFAVPDETPTSWLADLQTAVRQPIDHLSTYGLTIEKGTSFWNRKQRGLMSDVVEEDELRMYVDAIEHLTHADFTHYEVSNFARGGRQCQHNLAYWKGVGWYAAGPGAASFVDGKRQVNHRSPTTYMRRLLSGQSPIAESEQLSIEQLIRERIAFGLRMMAGIDLRDVGPVQAIESLLGTTLNRLQELGLLERCRSRLSLTRRGLLISDSVLTEILSPDVVIQ
ncbi:MAG: radical SAM family heme chaperone HemW [Pirellulaceae bacterium]